MSLSCLVKPSTHVSLHLMMHLQCYTVKKHISFPDQQWHLFVTLLQVTACMTAEPSLEDKST